MLERVFERAMYSARWLLAPIYLGLSIALLGIAIKFFAEAFHLISDILTISEMDLVLIVLSLVDLSLVGGLLVMVMFSGYENFVSRIDLDDNHEKLGWLGKLDTASLKNKVAASIVAISSIHLLKIFMEADDIAPETLKWYVIMHLTFVVSAFAMGMLDKLTRHAHSEEDL